MNADRKRLITRIIMGVLLIAMVSIMAAKLIVGNYTFESIIPQDSYTVITNMTFTGNGSDLVVRTFLPRSDERQKISGERIIAERLNFNRESTPPV